MAPTPGGFVTSRHTTRRRTSAASAGQLPFDQLDVKAPRSGAVTTERASVPVFTTAAVPPLTPDCTGAPVPASTAIDALAGHVGSGTCGAGDVRDDRTVDQRRADAFAAVFNGILDSGSTPPGTPVPTRHGKRTSLQVTVAASTLLGLDDLPGELSGFGPIPAYLARELSQDATWRRILTDPADGTFVEQGKITYRPGADLSGSVLTRDVTCAFPGCQEPAPRREIDHVEPFDPDRPAEQQTTAQNLQTLCKHHHQLKTRSRWNATRDPETGNAVWTSPAGITYARSPIPVDLSVSSLQHLGPPRSTPPHPDADDRPPF